MMSKDSILSAIQFKNFLFDILIWQVRCIFRILGAESLTTSLWQWVQIYVKTFLTLYIWLEQKQWCRCTRCLEHTSIHGSGSFRSSFFWGGVSVGVGDATVYNTVLKCFPWQYLLQSNNAGMDWKFAWLLTHCGICDRWRRASKYAIKTRGSQCIEVTCKSQGRVSWICETQGSTPNIWLLNELFWSFEYLKVNWVYWLFLAVDAFAYDFSILNSRAYL